MVSSFGLLHRCAAPLGSDVAEKRTAPCKSTLLLMLILLLITGRKKLILFLITGRKPASVTISHNGFA
jgi:hypothetical protein